VSERFWCTACGTVTRDMVCDCNRYGRTDCKPNFVNYADAMQEEAFKLAAQVNTLRAALSQFVAVCDTAPPTSLMTEIGIACAAARSALASDHHS
jgi:hypothetical protein